MLSMASLVPLALVMTDSSWSAVTAISVAFLGAAGLVVAEMVKTRQVVQASAHAAHGAQQAAEEARDLSRPTGNGFANRVVERLDRIEAAQRGIRGDVAGVRGDVAGVQRSLIDHLQAHSTAEINHRKS